jgi:hypothetical protein
MKTLEITPNVTAFKSLSCGAFDQSRTFQETNSIYRMRQNRLSRLEG